MPSGPPISTIPGGPVISTTAADPSDVPAEDRTAQARTAAHDASAYRLTGDVDLVSTGPITVDLRLSGDNADGRISQDGGTVEVQRRGLDYRSRVAGAGAWTDGDTARFPNGDTVSLPPLTDAGHWITELIPTPEAATMSPKPERQDGRQVTRIRLRGGTYLYVAATGTPYPVKLAQPDGQYPNLHFSAVQVFEQRHGDPAGGGQGLPGGAEGERLRQRGQDPGGGGGRVGQQHQGRGEPQQPAGAGRGGQLLRPEPELGEPVGLRRAERVRGQLPLDRLDGAFERGRQGGLAGPDQAGAEGESGGGDQRGQ
jgi:hypothetical protein